ncbi:hypothetical protein MIND_00407400 [Mycena indigotica]|uniref:Uncharacterized protein n=1 Tax=Mycena indigotica TaxID=2126181 RepID=A0A8H6T284_9AGAR|nr:uncharacterized protein MIND_00407400 [Mycena indigotica]KAF7310333.1 hypothetical protein MIND_00407400 [Mycena indigotica]
MIPKSPPSPPPGPYPTGGFIQMWTYDGVDKTKAVQWLEDITAHLETHGAPRAQWALIALSFLSQDFKAEISQISGCQIEVLHVLDWETLVETVRSFVTQTTHGAVSNLPNETACCVYSSATDAAPPNDQKSDGDGESSANLNQNAGSSHPAAENEKPVGKPRRFFDEHPIAATAATAATAAATATAAAVATAAAAAATAGLIVAAPILVPVALVSTLNVIGFGAGGVVAGSLAAAIQSVFYGGAVTSGSAFAIAQSIGAGGAAFSGAMPMLTAAGAAIGAAVA